MTETFEDQLSKIKSQASVLAELDERAVEVGVILPLLRQLGWDTEDVREVYPQRLVNVNTQHRVDYDLQTGGNSRVLIEVKRWRHALNDEDENQLRDYCHAAKPSLAVLTNGNHWRFYLPPLRATRKNPAPEIRQFFAFDITDEPGTVEEDFRRFLARDRLTNDGTVRRTVDSAKALFKEKHDHYVVMKDLANVWNELVADDRVLADLVKILADKHEIPANEAHVEEFLHSHSKGELVNKVTDNVKVKPPKPESFTFEAGQEILIVELEKKQWNYLVASVCLLMRERHPDEFRESILSISDWFSESESGFKYTRAVEPTGLWLKHCNAEDASQVTRKVVAAFGYAPESLTIQEV